jgi:hypothetical protein
MFTHVGAYGLMCGLSFSSSTCFLYRFDVLFLFNFSCFPAKQVTENIEKFFLFLLVLCINNS